jgi:hypothetical protein
MGDFERAAITIYWDNMVKAYLSGAVKRFEEDGTVQRIDDYVAGYAERIETQRGFTNRALRQTAMTVRNVATPTAVGGLVGLVSALATGNDPLEGAQRGATDGAVIGAVYLPFGAAISYTVVRGLKKGWQKFKILMANKYESVSEKTEAMETYFKKGALADPLKVAQGGTMHTILEDPKGCYERGCAPVFTALISAPWGAAKFAGIAYLLGSITGYEPDVATAAVIGGTSDFVRSQWILKSGSKKDKELHEITDGLSDDDRKQLQGVMALKWWKEYLTPDEHTKLTAQAFGNSFVSALFNDVGKPTTH